MPANLKPLTTLRFVAAAWVVLYLYWPDLTGAAMPGLIAKGYLGVELFFVLSGFILSHVYLSQFGERRFRYGSFLWARLARVYPLHIATLGGLLILITAAAAAGFRTNDNVAIWSSLPGQIVLGQAWGLTPLGGWNHPSWSISAEWGAYLAFPLFAWAAWRMRERPRLAVAAALALLAVMNLAFVRLAGFPLTEATIAWGAVRIIPCFAYGCSIYLLWRAGQVIASWAAATGVAAFAGAIAIAAGLGAPDPLTVALFGALIFFLAALSSSGSRLLSSRVEVYLGEVSFAVYMVCIPWKLVFTNGAQRALDLPAGPVPWPLWTVMLLGVIPVAIVAHHLVERPSRSAMRAWEAAGFRFGPPPRGWAQDSKAG